MPTSKGDQSLQRRLYAKQKWIYHALRGCRYGDQQREITGSILSHRIRPAEGYTRATLANRPKPRYQLEKRNVEVEKGDLVRRTERPCSKIRQCSYPTTSMLRRQG